MSEATPSGESGLPVDEEEWRYFSGADRSGEIGQVHRLRVDNRMQRRRYAVCGLVEDARKAERLNFTIDPDDVTCGDCQPVDTGAVCPARRRWWHWRPRPHRVAFWGSVDMGNARWGGCAHCGRTVQQRLSYSGKPIGPVLDDVRLPCDHGRGGVPLMACTGCAAERAERGLYG